MRVTSTTFLPLLVAAGDERYSQEHVLDEFLGDLAVAYTFGPPYGERLVTWTDLDRFGMARWAVRRSAAENLYAMVDQVRIHGQPPALMLSFDGLESSVLLVDDFWESLKECVPGDLVIGAPARDVVIITGSESNPGLEKARRAIDRVFFAGGQHLLSRDPLVRRRGRWEMFRPVVPRQRMPRPGGPPR